jgi:hypothetical protein
LTIQHSQDPTVEAPTVEMVTVETPMVEMHTVTMVMHIPAALVLQLVVAVSFQVTEMELAADLAVLAVLAVTVDKAAAAATLKIRSFKIK